MRDPFNVSYAVCTGHGIVESAKLPETLSAQAAQLFALTCAFILGTGQNITVYTDSQYAFNVCHNFHALWTNRGIPHFHRQTYCPLKHFSLNDVSLLQTGADTGEKSLWKKKGCKELSSDVWVDANGLPILPKFISPFLVKLTHGPDHVVKGGMMDILNKLWYAPGFSTFADHFCKKCVVCTTNNVGRGVPMPLSAHPKPEGPFEHLMMDFILLTPCRS